MEDKKGMCTPGLLGKYVKGVSALSGHETRGQIVGSYIHVRKPSLSFLKGGSETRLALIIRNRFGMVDEIHLNKPVDISDQPYQ